jgi:hypothetical protein
VRAAAAALLVTLLAAAAMGRLVLLAATPCEVAEPNMSPMSMLKPEGAAIELIEPELVQDVDEPACTVYCSANVNPAQVRGTERERTSFDWALCGLSSELPVASDFEAATQAERALESELNGRASGHGHKEGARAGPGVAACGRRRPTVLPSTVPCDVPIMLVVRRPLDEVYWTTS